MKDFVPLVRRFIIWSDEDSGDPEFMSYLLASSEALTWDDLLEKHRVVILAEAGSGTTTELCPGEMAAATNTFARIGGTKATNASASARCAAASIPSNTPEPGSS